MAERQTMHDFVRKHGVTMTCERANSNPAMEDSQNMDHWRCTLKSGGKRLTIVFSMGSGHHGKEPEAADVLNCLASDASSVLNSGGWEDFASDMGMPLDEPDDRRKAKKTYNACVKEHDQLQRLLGDSAVQELIYQTEGL